MKLRVVHLIRKLEKIDRDLSELDSLKHKIHLDRHYANSINKSLIDESTRLKSLKSKIFAQVIKEPPELLLEKFHVWKNTNANNIESSGINEDIIPEIEINLPEKKEKSSPVKENKKTDALIKNEESENIDNSIASEKIAKESQKKDNGKDQDTPSFQFKYE